MHSYIMVVVAALCCTTRHDIQCAAAWQLTGDFRTVIYGRMDPCAEAAYARSTFPFAWYDDDDATREDGAH